MQLSLLKRNVAANFLGRGMTAMMLLIVVPLYIDFLGIEAYGIIGFFTSLVVLSAVFDVGLSVTANRELARLTAVHGNRQKARDLTRSLEVIYWVCAIVLGVVASLAAGPIAHHWLRVEHLSAQEVERTVRIMVLVLAIQFPISFYSGCLLGLQKHVLLNIVNTAAVAGQVLAVIFVLGLLSSTLTAFFVTQGIARAAHTFVLAFLVWRTLKTAPRPAQFRMAEVRKVWRFAAGMTGVSIIGLILTQIDMVILSRLLPLSQLGYYALAKAVAQALFIFVGPVFTAVFPHFSQLVALCDEQRLRRTYHRSAQIISIAVLPAMLLLVLFSREILWAWTGDSATVANAAILVSLLALGTGLNGILNVPYALQLANGWVSFVWWANVAALAFFGPAIVVLTHFYGAAGAAFAWVTLNVGITGLILPLMHRHLFRGQLQRWYIHDFLIPLLPSLVITILAYGVLPPIHGRLTTVLVLAFIYGTSALASIMTVSWLRRQLTQTFQVALRLQWR